MEGKVTRITNFGAFVELGNGKSGLVHISEIANCFVNDVHDFLEEGQTVKVKVLSADNGRINLSIKKTLPPQERPAHHGPRSSQDRPMHHSGPHSGTHSGPHAAAPHTGGGRGGAPYHHHNGPRAQRQQTPPISGDQAFEDKLKQFLTLSEGKMADLNRNIDGKRGGGRRRR